MATIQLPTNAPAQSISIIKDVLNGSYPFLDIDYLYQEDLRQPQVVSVDRNGADLGSINGDKDLPCIDIATGLHLEAIRAWEGATQRGRK